MKFRPIAEVVKEKEEQNHDTYLPDPEEIDTWVPDFADDYYFRLPKEYASSSGIMGYFQDGQDKDFFKWVKTKTCALEVGSLIHCHILTPDDIENFAAQQARINNDFPKYNTVVDECVSAIRENHEIMEALEGTERELAGMIHNYRGGKARIKADAISHERGIIYDLKTTSKYSPAAFEKDVCKPDGQIKYYIQAAFYIDVANRIAELTGSPHRYNTFQWLVVCKRSLKTGIVECSPELIQLGLEKISQFYKEKGWEK